jgi:hypothetical protein
MLANSELPETFFAASESRFSSREMRFAGSEIDFPGREFRVKTRKSNTGAGVPFYDSIASYDSGLLYDDPSSPQPDRRRTVNVKLGLQKLTPDQKVDLANTIKTAMTGNANFTTPNPTLAAYGTLITPTQDC